MYSLQHDNKAKCLRHWPQSKVRVCSQCDATVASDEPETGRLVIILINSMVEMKVLDHHLLCPIDAAWMVFCLMISYSSWENQLKKSMRMKVSSRENSQWKLHSETCLTQSTIDKITECSATGDGFSALTFQAEDNYLSTLLHHMLMMLQMLWMMTTMPKCWKALSLNCHQK